MKGLIILTSQFKAKSCQVICDHIAHELQAFCTKMT